MSGEDVSQITHALLRPDTALDAVRALRGNPDRAAVEGLVELACRSRTARDVEAAIAALEPSSDPIILDALRAALDNPNASVRLAAVQDLHRRQVCPFHALVRVLRGDESWPVRRAALWILAGEPGPARWEVLTAATDPHWRVRYALIRVLLRWGESEADRREIDQRLTLLRLEATVLGVRAYLHYRWTGHLSETSVSPRDSGQACPFWGWDAAVLFRQLVRMGESGRRQALDAMPSLLTHADERIRALAKKTLRDWGDVSHFVPVVALLDEPRQEGMGEVVKLLSELDLDLKEGLARVLLRLSEPKPAQIAWALDQIGLALPAEEEHEVLLRLMREAAMQPPVIRRALARLAGRWVYPAAGDWLRGLAADPDSEVQCEALRGLKGNKDCRLDERLLSRLLGSEDVELRTEAVTAAVHQRCGGDLLERLADDPDVRVRVRLAEVLAARDDGVANNLVARLQRDPHPHVRSAAMTLARAADLIKEPLRETSWHVLARAARLARVPLWQLEPTQPWRPTPMGRRPVEPLQPREAVAPPTRPLGPDRLAIAPLGISGHYGLPVEGFVRAYEAGVNLMFWEPNYRTLTEFISRLWSTDRNAIHLMTGTFEADGERVRRDAERVLRTLKIERIALFLLFWVQTWERVTPDVRAALEQLKAEGKIADYGLSTHSRSLALEALDAGWDPVMVRHSAAHRGAEDHIFPRAAERGTSLITFSNTCYGRLLEPRDGLPPPSAADCYRYTLVQPGVRACLSAPASLAQLEENLAALLEPSLPEERRQYLQAFGRRLYEEETMFRKFVRFP